MLWRANNRLRGEGGLRPFSAITCLIPAYRASITISQVVQRVRLNAPGASILVVDDGSADETPIVAQAAGADVLSHRMNRGKGAALQTGFDRILRDGQAEYVATIDADLQHRPEELADFLTVLTETDADIVVGSRERWGNRMPIERALSNTITSALVRARTGIEIEDSQCGYRLIRRKVLEQVRISSPGYEAETEFLIKAARKGFRIASVPIHTIYTNEPSHMTHLQTTLRFVQVLFRDY